MSERDLVLYKPHGDNSILNTRVKTKDYSDPQKRKELAELLRDHCMKHKALGIAANQIGLEERVFFSRGLAFFNPEVLSGKHRKLSKEGCLSLLGVTANVGRHEVIEVIYMDESGNERNEILSGQDAIVFQHEIDHLNGKTLIDRIPSKLMRDKFLKKYKKAYNKVK